MASRDRITLGMALAIVVVTVIVGQIPYISVPLALFAVFLIVWGRESRRTEALIRRLPGGRYALKVLNQLDRVLSPRDREYDKHIKAVVADCDANMLQSLRILWRTRNTSRISPEYLHRFTEEGLIEYPPNGPGRLKPELQVFIGRLLDELSGE